MKPTLKTVKASPLYLAYVGRVEKLWPGRSNDFARELLKAYEGYEGYPKKYGFNFESCDIFWAFCWEETPQGHDAWENFFCITREVKL